MPLNSAHLQAAVGGFGFPHARAVPRDDGEEARKQQQQQRSVMELLKGNKLLQLFKLFLLHAHGYTHFLFFFLAKFRLPFYFLLIFFFLTLYR